jgi:hypothetical protein
MRQVHVRSPRILQPSSTVTVAILALLASGSAVRAQQTVVRLWPGGAPGSESWTQKEVEYGRSGNRGVRNVADPSLTVFLPVPKTATGAAVIIAPGGAFRMLAWEKEGTDNGCRNVVLQASC